MRDLAPPVVRGCGATAGVLYWLAIFPLDVVKSAMMTDNIDPAKRQYPTMALAFKVGGLGLGKVRPGRLRTGRGGMDLGRDVWAGQDLELCVSWVGTQRRGSWQHWDALVSVGWRRMRLGRPDSLGSCCFLPYCMASLKCGPLCASC